MSDHPTRPPRIALEVWGGDPLTIVETARRAEAAGLDGVYVGESPTGLNAEAWTTLGLIAGVTERIRIGPVITNLLSDYRSPVLLARQSATLAAASDGRLDFRTGVGASQAAGRAWWQPAGVDYPSYESRWAEADRQLALLRSLWAANTVEVDEVPFRLGLDHPAIPVTIAARSARGLALAERHADAWEASWCTTDEWRGLAAELHVPDRLAASLEVDGFVATDASRADALWRRVAVDRDGEDLDLLRAKSLHGTPEVIAEQVAAYAAVGVDQLVVALHDPHDADAITALGRAVADW